MLQNNLLSVAGLQLLLAILTKPRSALCRNL